jgi:hypothetical protein
MRRQKRSLGVIDSLLLHLKEDSYGFQHNAYWIMA